jgi:exodeoxyribonuclease VII small subunit
MEKHISFEDALAKLTELVAELENGNLPLAAIKERIVESTHLIEQCRKQLRELPPEIEKLQNLLE